MSLLSLTEQNYEEYLTVGGTFVPIDVLVLVELAFLKECGGEEDEQEHAYSLHYCYGLEGGSKSDGLGDEAAEKDAESHA